MKEVGFVKHKIKYIVAAIIIILQLAIIVQLCEIKHSVDLWDGLCGKNWDRMDDQDIKWFEWVEEYR